MRSAIWFLAGVLWAGGGIAAAPNEKLDDGLAAARGPVAVFVRMNDQLIGESGAFEKFCAEHERDDRRELRREVVDTLRTKSDASWRQVQTLVEKLEQSGGVSSVRRYWIVNGFACRATADACAQLAGHASVSFVYRQRLPGVPLQERPGAATTNVNARAIYENVLADLKDDSDDPLTLEGVTIPWNVKRVRADEAWSAGATGKGIVVALSDSGLIVTPSLVRALWKNPGEELNGLDDDGNGYVDDLFGYDFAARSWYALGDGPVMTHGSMCGGIIAGRPLNAEKLQTGVAPRAKLMVLRGMGFLESYEYAVANGADVFSMSYMWIGVPLGNYRGLYRTAHEHMAAAGVVAVGGAGNFAAGRGAQPVGKQIALPKDIPCVIAAAGIVEDGSQPEFSSGGPCTWADVKFYSDYPEDRPLAKPDVTACIGGFPVWGRSTAAQRVAGWKVVSDEGNGIALVVGPQGNSFSGPHAAGAAALVLSANPALTAWQVKRILEQTSQDLGPEGFDPRFGHGLLDAAAAVKAARR